MCMKSFDFQIMILSSVMTLVNQSENEFK